MAARHRTDARDTETPKHKAEKMDFWNRFSVLTTAAAGGPKGPVCPSVS